MKFLRQIDALPLPCFLTSRAIVQTINYNGEKRTTGDDPVRAELSLVDSKQRVDCKVIDHANGLYRLIAFLNLNITRICIFYKYQS